MATRPNPADLRAQADELFARGEALLAAGKRDEALRVFVESNVALELARELERRERLTSGDSSITTNEMDATVSRSVGHTSPEDAYIRALNKKGLTLSSAAKLSREEAIKIGRPGLGVSQPMLSMALRGDRVLSDEKREHLERVTGVKFAPKKK